MRPSAAGPKLFEGDELICQQHLDIRVIQVDLIGGLVYQYECGELMGTQHHRLLGYSSMSIGGTTTAWGAASLAIAFLAPRASAKVE